jgi:hypothetical protein
MSRLKIKKASFFRHFLGPSRYRRGCVVPRKFTGSRYSCRGLVREHHARRTKPIIPICPRSISFSNVIHAACIRFHYVKAGDVILRIPMHTRSATVTMQAPLAIDNPPTPFSPMERSALETANEDVIVCHRG